MVLLSNSRRKRCHHLRFSRWFQFQHWIITSNSTTNSVCRCISFFNYTQHHQVHSSASKCNLHQRSSFISFNITFHSLRLRRQVTATTLLTTCKRHQQYCISLYSFTWRFNQFIRRRFTSLRMFERSCTCNQSNHYK